MRIASSAGTASSAAAVMVGAPSPMRTGARAAEEGRAPHRGQSSESSPHL